MFSICPDTLADIHTLQAHLARLAKETIEKSRTDDVKNVQHRAEQREAELNAMLDRLETRHSQYITL